MKYLIIGAGGFLGSTLVKHLQQAGEEVYYTTRSEIAHPEGSKAIRLDITKPEQFGNISLVPDVVINCASALPDASQEFSDPSYLDKLFRTNTLGGANIMNWAASRNIRKVINCSTLVVVNKPWPVPLTEKEDTYPKGRHVGYSASKLAQELVMSAIAETHGLQLLHVRISALYGPGMKGEGILQKFIRQAAARETLQLTNGNNVSFDFLHVNDAVKVLHHLAKLAAWQDPVINLASGEELSLLKLAEIICELTGNSTKNIVNTDQENFSSRAKIDNTLLSKYLAGTGIHTGSFAEKVKSLVA